MKYQIVGKNLTISDKIETAFKHKLSRIEKHFFSKDEINCRVVVSSLKLGVKVEVTVFVPQMTLRAEVSHDDLLTALDFAIDKLQGQLRKLKTRMDRSSSRPSFAESISFDSIESDGNTKNDIIVRAKSYYLEPMNIEEAINHMLALGHSFFMYLDKDDDRVSTVYVRNDGGYGVIQAENEIK